MDASEHRAQGLGETLGKAVAWAGKAAFAIGGVAIAAGTMAAAFTDDLKGALNDVQAATGKSDEEMIGLKDTMLSLYNQNFGEDFEDIGKALSEVGKQTGLAGKELEEMTKNALILRDAFEYEVGESTEAANQLMKQFGITGKEAYNLIAQGAQGGLDKGGELLDSIKEYSVQFAGVGLSVEDMFNMLKNGSAGGAYSIDKLGDAVKEFGIRTKDGSKGTSEAFKALGLDSAKLSADFAKGGEASKAAFLTTNKALLSMTDPLKQNELGVALYGTTWEDVGVKGIKALTDTKGEIDKNKEALNQINDVKYDTFGEAMEGIKRNLQTGILLPLGEEILPMMQQFQTWVIENMPKIKENIANAMEKASEVIVLVKDNSETLIKVLGFLGGAWVAHKSYVIAATLATEAMNIALGLQKAYVAASTAATWLFNAALTANPIGLTVLAIMGLVGVLITVTGKWDAVTGAIEKAFNWLTKWNDEPTKDKTVTLTTNQIQINEQRNIRTNNDGNDGRLDKQLIRNAGNNAEGTDFWQGGLTWVGEEGPELINAPRGSQIFSNGESMAMAGGAIGGSIGGITRGNITINISDANIMDDYGVDRMMDRVIERLGQKINIFVRD